MIVRNILLLESLCQGNRKSITTLATSFFLNLSRSSRRDSLVYSTNFSINFKDFTEFPTFSPLPEFELPLVLAQRVVQLVPALAVLFICMLRVLTEFKQVYHQICSQKSTVLDLSHLNRPSAPLPAILECSTRSWSCVPLLDDLRLTLQFDGRDTYRLKIYSFKFFCLGIAHRRWPTKPEHSK